MNGMIASASVAENEMTGNQTPGIRIKIKPVSDIL
jgi:hypothetical protein